MRFLLRWLVCVVAAIVVLAIGVWIYLPPYLAFLKYEPRDGDIVFQSLPYGPLVKAIEGATHSPFSHCGIVAHEDGGWYVYEAFHGVERTGLRSWCARGRDSAFKAFRLEESQQAHVPQMLDYARSQLGRPYDIHYSMDDEALYCSKLVFKGFRNASGESLGEVVRFGDLDWQPYRPLIEKIEHGNVPVDRLMIPPRQLSEAKQLRPVFSYGYPE